MTGSPAIFLPRISGSDMFWSSNAWLPISSDRLTISRFGLGSSMPITLRPGMVATRAESADMLRAMSSASAITRLALMPLAGSSSYIVTTGPGRTSTMSPRTLKSSSTVSSRRALRSRPARSICWRFSFGGGDEQVDRRQLVAVAERQARLGAATALRPWRGPPAQRSGAARLTATAGLRPSAERPASGRSSRISVLRGAARRSRGSRRNKPRNPAALVLGQAEREIADAKTGETEQQQRGEARRAGDLRIADEADRGVDAMRGGKPDRPAPAGRQPDTAERWSGQAQRRAARRRPRRAAARGRSARPAAGAPSAGRRWRSPAGRRPRRGRTAAAGRR